MQKKRIFLRTGDKKLGTKELCKKYFKIKYNSATHEIHVAKVHEDNSKPI